jgi:hypothetical protein
LKIAAAFTLIDFKWKGFAMTIFFKKVQTTPPMNDVTILKSCVTLKGHTVSMFIV